MEAYASGRLGAPTLRSIEANRIIAIGSDRVMPGVAKARHEGLKAHLNLHHFAIGSINSPMQCMMKEICAQRLQLHRDPLTGEVTHAFACFNHDQPLDSVDFHLLNERLKQQARITRSWPRCATRARSRSAWPLSASETGGNAAHLGGNPTATD